MALTNTASPPMPPGPISGPSAWRGADLQRSTAWIYVLTDAERGELHAAMERVRVRDLLEVGRADFALPTLGPKLDEIRRELLHGRGFVLIRGIDRARYDLRELATIYWGLGMHVGKARSQNAAGHVIGHVRDVGRREDDPDARIYQTNRRQYYHTDSVDIVGLLCVNKARRGGLSSLVSSVTIYNAMRARRPDLAAAMFEPFHTDRRGEVPAGMKPWFAIPVFTWYEGRLTTMYVRRYIESARRFDDVPPLTDTQRAAMDLFDQLAEDPDLNLFMEFEPGDIQLVHNHQILHDRTEFEDWPEPARRRHLLRLWLCPPDGRPLPPAFAARYGSVTIGDRGGIVVPDSRLTVSLD
jgi:hypothetical protein